MATVASLIANPVFLRNPRPKLNAAKPSAGRHASVSFSSAPKFKVDLKLKSFLISTEENNRYSCLTITTDSRKHASMCTTPNAIKNHIGIEKPLGRVGGKWSTAYPYNPTTENPSDSPWELVCLYIIVFPLLAVCICTADVPIWLNLLVLIFFATSMALDSWSCGETSVVKLQVGFSGQGPDLGFDLNRIAESADTSTYKGLSYVLNETIVALLRHHKYKNSSSVSVVSKFGREASLIHIDRLSINERLGHKETLVNVNSMKLQRPASQESYNKWQDDDIMVTLFVGAKGKVGHELPTNYNDHDFENFLQELRIVGSSNSITAVEVLWTPQISPCSAATNVLSMHYGAVGINLTNVVYS
ncbi:hypothetical protein ACLB2K_037005 [Fragaria x ananassa]